MGSGAQPRGMSVSALASVLAVDPVPWARAQMAFTLGFHIILVPLGVSWAFMALVANYRGLRHDDGDALLLAQRWSKFMAVTFAVGAVTGTVLTFEFGLLWPNFMGRFGAAFGIPFAIEGLFFFTEAIFIAIYIYGWRRLKPWLHFWCGVPIVIAGIGGTVSVVAANAWMNQPGGFTLDSAGKVVDVDPLSVIFNDAMPYEAVHMLLAAYLVGGFLIASIYAVGMLRGRRDRYHRLGFIIPFTIAAIATPLQMAGGRHAGPLGLQQRADQVRGHRAGARRPRATSRRRCSVGSTPNDQVTGGIPIPDLASWLSDPGDGANTVIQGLDSYPADERPTIREANTVHLAWDVMVGIATLLFLLSVWYGLCWLFRRDMPRLPLVPAHRVVRRRGRDPGAGGGLGGHRGRPPALDRTGLHEGGRRGDHERGRLGDVPRHHRRLRGGRRDRDPGPAGHEPALASPGRQRGRRERRPLRPEPATRCRVGDARGSARPVRFPSDEVTVG